MESYCTWLESTPSVEVIKRGFVSRRLHLLALIWPDYQASSSGGTSARKRKRGGGGAPRIVCPTALLHLDEVAADGGWDLATGLAGYSRFAALVRFAVVDRLVVERGLVAGFPDAARARAGPPPPEPLITAAHPIRLRNHDGQKGPGRRPLNAPNTGARSTHQTPAAITEGCHAAGVRRAETGEATTRRPVRARGSRIPLPGGWSQRWTRAEADRRPHRNSRPDRASPGNGAATPPYTPVQGREI
jgi:hypothetical protein